MSRYKHTFRKNKIRHDSKTIPIPGHRDYGDGEDHGVWYKCWNCGFRCNIDRDELGESDDEAGMTPTAYNLTDQYGNSTGYCYGAAGAGQTACEANGGTWTTVKYKPVVSAGCPFCGTRNWRGDY